LPEKISKEEKKTVLKPIAIWLVLAGILTLASIITLVFYLGSIGSTLGFLLILSMTFLSAYEISISRSVWSGQVGEWSGVLRALFVSMLARGLLIFFLWGPYNNYYTDPNIETITGALFYLNVISLLVEGSSLGLIYYKRNYFAPPPEEVESAMRRMKVTGVKTLSDCPKCKNLVEADWHSCPSCGTVLPKFCVNCGTAVNEDVKQCPKCGTEIQSSKAIANLIETLRQTAELPASPETKSVRYEKYAEALIKGGRTDEAIEAYRKSIHFTQFYRKQTNFMVKMAMVYHNTGRDNQAMDLLDASLELDPEDWAGAKQLKDEIQGNPGQAPMPKNTSVTA
jgi:RNA polymerase subunit RPABC4/transcription elongation factor Spt4